MYVILQEKELAPPEEKFNRAGLEDLLKRRFFYSVSYGIYGGGYRGCTDRGLPCGTCVYVLCSQLQVYIQ